MCPTTERKGLNLILKEKCIPRQLAKQSMYVCVCVCLMLVLFRPNMFGFISFLPS